MLDIVHSAPKYESASCPKIIFPTLLVIALTGCGGGGPIHQPEPVVSDYSKSAGTFRYAPHRSLSHAFIYGDTVFIGSDVEPREKLRSRDTDSHGINYYGGASRDGVGVHRLENYAEDLITEDGTVSAAFSDSVLRPFRVPPKVWVDRRLFDDSQSFSAFWQTWTQINDALPPEFQVELGGTLDERPRRQEGDIFIELAQPSGIGATCGQGAVACARQWGLVYPDNRAHSAHILIPDDIGPDDLSRNTEVLVHEFLHALGIMGHVDSIEFPDSIMGETGDFFPNPGFVIHRIDREILQILYMSQKTALYNDWGEWSDTALHMMGIARDESYRFGVSLFNGLPQPWARGEAPSEALADNDGIRGRATWEGGMVGFSGPSPLKGDVSMTVDMSNLRRYGPDSLHDLQFRNIYYMNRFDDQSPDRWFSTRNMDYEVNIFENYFHNFLVVRDESDGLITGHFFGKGHHAMGGTIKRTDMIGSFGGARD